MKSILFAVLITILSVPAAAQTLSVAEQRAENLRRLKEKQPHVDFSKLPCWAKASDNLPDRTDHIEECAYYWEVRTHSLHPDKRFIMVRGYPDARDTWISFGCNPSRGIKFDLGFVLATELEFYGPEDRLHLQIGFSSRVRADDGGWVLKHETIDLDKHRRPWNIKSRRVRGIGRNAAAYYDGEALDLLRRIYHSDRVSWTNLKNGRTSHAVIGPAARAGIKELLDSCHVSFDSD